MTIRSNLINRLIALMLVPPLALTSAMRNEQRAMGNDALPMPTSFLRVAPSPFAFGAQALAPVEFGIGAHPQGVLQQDISATEQLASLVHKQADVSSPLSGVVIYAPHQYRGSFITVEPELEKAFELLGGPGEKYTVLLEMGNPAYPHEMDSLLMSADFLTNPILEQITQALDASYLRIQQNDESQLERGLLSWRQFANGIRHNSDPSAQFIHALASYLADKQTQGYDLHLSYERSDATAEKYFGRALAFFRKSIRIQRGKETGDFDQAVEEIAAAMAQSSRLRAPHVFANAIPAIVHEKGRRVLTIRGWIHLGEEANAPEELTLAAWGADGITENDVEPVGVLGRRLAQGQSSRAEIRRLTRSTMLYWLLMPTWKEETIPATVWSRMALALIRTIPLEQTDDLLRRLQKEKPQNDGDACTITLHWIGALEQANVRAQMQQFLDFAMESYGLEKKAASSSPNKKELGPGSRVLDRQGRIRTLRRVEDGRVQFDDESETSWESIGRIEPLPENESPADPSGNSGRFSPGAQHPKRKQWFPVLLKRMGFAKLNELENDPLFQRIVETAGITEGIKTGAVLFEAWGQGRPDERLTESVALAFSIYSRKKAAEHGPVAPDVQKQALERLMPFVAGQLPDHKIEMKETQGPLRLQVLADPGKPWQRNLVFEVIDSKDEEKSGAHYFPFLKTGNTPAYVIQIQLRDMQNVDRLLEIIDHEVLETAWRALGSSEKKADEYALEHYRPSLVGVHKRVAEAPGQPGMEHDRASRTSSQTARKKLQPSAGRFLKSMRYWYSKNEPILGFWVFVALVGLNGKDGYVIHSMNYRLIHLAVSYVTLSLIAWRIHRRETNAQLRNALGAA